MHPELEALTPHEACRLIDSPMALTRFIDSLGGVGVGTVMQFLFDLSDKADDEPPLGSRHRPDAARLLEFVGRAGALSPRLRQVAMLCLADGLSLDECAEALGISRGTVRVHLRRLRRLERACRQREC